MAKDIELLEEEFKVKAVALLETCEAGGFKLVPFFTLRDVWSQAKLWRQSRPLSQIELAIKMLQRNSASWLASVLEGVGPQFGRWATNALPGMSWHNYGQAIDCFVLDQANGRAIWSANHDGYRVYAKEAIKLGLIPGYYWRRRDAVHVQAVQERVREKYDWPKIEEMMEERFGNKAEVKIEPSPSDTENATTHSPPEELEKLKSKVPGKKTKKKKEGE